VWYFVWYFVLPSINTKSRGMEQRRVLVLGAGIIGLTTAKLLREALPQVPLALWAKQFPPDTTSNRGICYLTLLPLALA
jgi:lactate dehydrogenase-like 2-hydroxyacid dehydrogenase